MMGDKIISLLLPRSARKARLERRGDSLKSHEKKISQILTLPLV
jgi:hypothetical protein